MGYNYINLQLWNPVIIYQSFYYFRGLKEATRVNKELQRNIYLQFTVSI